MCVNPQTDNMNCGGCGMACGAGTACTMGVCRPTNDLRAMGVAVALAPGAEVTRTGSNRNATSDAPAGACGCTGNNVWYRVTVATDGVLYADTQGTQAGTGGFDSSILVTNAAGTILTAGTGEQWCQDDNSTCSAVATWGLRDARVYGWVSAGTYDVAVGGCAQGSYSLHLQFLPRSSSDYWYTTPLSGNGLTASTVLTTTSVSSSACGGTASGEDARWFVTCGGQPQTFSLCRSDGVGFLGLSHPEWERTNGTTSWDPSAYIRSGNTGGELTCNDDGTSMGGTDCHGYDSSMGGAIVSTTANYGSRLNAITVPRGVASVFVDGRVAGGGMHYRLLHRIVDAP